MLIFRWLAILFALGIIASFALYVGTGQAHFKRFGLLMLKWCVLAGLGFFAVLILERVA
jgi:membrane-associated PAP2 superfamily phosphatase